MCDSDGAPDTRGGSQEPRGTPCFSESASASAKLQRQQGQPAGRSAPRPAG